MKTIYRKIDDAKFKKLPIVTPDPESETEQSGYIPPKVQIENMILAGQRLDHARSQYDFESEEDIDDDLYDPTRSGNYDLADATQSALAVEARLKEQAVKPSQTAQEAPEGLPEPPAGVLNPPRLLEPEKGSKCALYTAP